MATSVRDRASVTMLEQGGLNCERSEQVRFGRVQVRWREAPLREPCGGLGAQPPAGSRGRAPVRGLGGGVPRKILETLRLKCWPERQSEKVKLVIFADHKICKTHKIKIIQYF